MKIISLSPSFTEILCGLGSSETLMGVTDQCPETVPSSVCRVGAMKLINVASLEPLKPDYVLALAGENRPEQIREIQKSYQVITFDVRSVEAVKDTIHHLGRLTGKIVPAKEMSDKISAEWEENRRIFRETKPVPALVLLWSQPYLTVNFDTYISRLVEASGGVNVFHSDPLPEFPVDIEDMIEKNPELLILPTAPFYFKKSHIAAFRKFRVFSQIRIEMFDGKLFSYFGPKTIEALKKLRALFQNKHA